ncbi:long-chain-fatty-acid--CoA ligase 2 [[Candida] anglica]|uniref:Long-chain-fatty-acid--CoA ligase 2 n=1 Tax=[Candida] anglica TaxID=148631 RepID=A0ABP0E5S3_9ASCO
MKNVYSPDSPYVFQSNTNESLDELIEQYLPLQGAGSDLVKRSVPIPGTATDGFSEIYRNAAFPNSVKRGIHPDLDTYGKFFAQSVRSKGDQPCFAYREYDYVQKKSANSYTEISYREVNERKKRFGSGLLYLLQNSSYKQPEKYESHALIDSHVSNYGKFNKDKMSFILTVFAPNRYEWILTDLMCSDFSITNSSLYDTLGPDVSKYILELTESPVIVLAKHNIQTVLNLKKRYPKELGNLIMLISMDPLDLEGDNQSRSFEDISNVQYARELGCTLIDLERVEKIGQVFPHIELPSTPESTYTISFTSGTTGSRPKGVVLSHTAAGAGITFVLAQMPNIPGGRAFAFLPLAHIFERQNTAFVLSYGGCVGFPQLEGSPLTLVEDLQLFKPNHMSNVPRVLTKFEAAIKAATVDHPTSSFTRGLFERVLGTKMELQSQKDGEPGKHLVIDNLLLKKIRAKFGYDNMLFSVTGSAPISVSTVTFLKAALNIGIAQGYGLTESFAGMALTEPYDISPGSCGSTGVCTEMKIRELPAMGYHLNDAEGPRGELLLRGFQNFSHYYKNPEETEKAIDKDGWFYTGDVARIDSRGRIYIIDRVKNFFKLSQGEYVTPEKVENAYLSSNSILQQLFVHGTSLEHYLVGIVGVDLELTRNFLAERCHVPKSHLASEREVIDQINKKENKAILLEYLNANVSKSTKLQGFEKIHNIYSEIEPLRLDRDVVTPTMKLKRPIASKFFDKSIKEMYAEGSLLNGTKL